MTKLLQQAFEHASRLPDGDQDVIARAVLALAGLEAVATLAPEERAAIDRSLAAAAQGDFADDAAVAAVWAKHGL